MKDLVNDQRTTIEPIIREQLYRDSGFELISASYKCPFSWYSRASGEWIRIDWRQRNNRGHLQSYLQVLWFRRLWEAPQLQNGRKVRQNLIHLLQILYQNRTKLDEYSVKVVTQEVEQKELLLGRKTTVFNNREDTDDYLTVDYTGESYERRKVERTFTENLISNLGSALRRKTRTWFY